MPTNMPDPSASLDLSQIDALRLTITRLARRLRKHSIANLTPTQISALTTLDRQGRMRTGRLSELEGIGKSTTTRLVRRLEAMGLVKRTVDETDARSWQVELTREGEQLLQASSAQADEYLSRQVAALLPDERRRLMDALPVLDRLLQVKA